MKKKYLFLVIFVSIFVNSCSKKVESVKSTSTSVSSAKASAGSSLNNIVFNVAPEVNANCDSPNYKADVSWDVSAAGITAVTILADDSESEAKIWVQGGATGQETTGEWVNSKTTLQLTNSTTGEVLVVHHFGVLECTQK